ncbi:MAG: 4Fe-4S binding protein [Deltaproteobacteria bacterium]|jgi:polyferredoxin|nr:4Fe-4S binding protein [Deltaproteobacteria bacterium]
MLTKRIKIQAWMHKNQYHARSVVQILFLALVMLIGVRFWWFVEQIEKGVWPGFERPPGVEAFLPISALVSLKHFLFTGTINTIHPSALVLFIIICMTAVIAKKSFCSWICPFGLLSEFFNKLNRYIYKKSLFLPLWMDLPLRSVKYLIAGFFIWSIFYNMPMDSIELFIQSPYNRFADIKMLRFFTQISITGLITILVLCFLSIIIQNFWCRYLCPYGALLGIISFLSIGRIKRNKVNCTKCGKCEQHCPGLIHIRQKDQIHSSECTACMSCINHCPEKNAIGFSLFSGKLPITQAALGFVLVLLFTTGIFMAKSSGNWQNTVSKNEYFRYGIQSRLSLNGKAQIDPQKMEKMMEMMKQMEAQKSKVKSSSKRKGD